MTLEGPALDDGPPDLGPEEAAAAASSPESPPQLLLASRTEVSSELERLTALHAERVRALEAERWRLGERISALESKNLDLQGDLLEQTRGLNQELATARKALAAEREARLADATSAKELEAERTSALRREQATEIRMRDEHAASLLTELLRAKDAIVAHAKEHEQALFAERARTAEQLENARAELMADLNRERDRTNSALDQLLRAKDEIIALQQSHAMALSTQRTAWANLQEAQLHRIAEIEQRLATKHEALRAELEHELASREHRTHLTLEALTVGARMSLDPLGGPRSMARAEAQNAQSESPEAQAIFKPAPEDDSQLLAASKSAAESPRTTDCDSGQTMRSRRGDDHTEELSRLGHDEVARLRQRVAAMENDAQRYRRAAAALEQQVDKAKNTLSYRLGYILIHGPKTWAGLQRMPSELLKLHAEAKRRRTAKLGVLGSSSSRAPSQKGRTSTEEFVEEVMRLFAREGSDAAARFAEFGAPDAPHRAAALTQLAKALKTSDPATALGLAERAYTVEPLAFRAKWLAFLKYDCGQINEAARLVKLLPADFSLKPSEKARAAEIMGLARVVAKGIPVPPLASRPYEAKPASVLYVAASAMPFQVSGYTVRTQSLLRSINRAGVHVAAALRPGYPWDRGVEVRDDSGQHSVDDVTYLHLPGPHVRRMPLDEYVEVAAQKIYELALRTRPELIHAASNYVNALPALLAARRLGVPFIYEVRGMWELTAATRQIDWERSERFALDRSLEALVATNADHVLTLTEGLASDLAARGVPRQRISLAPNSVDPTRFTPRRKDPELLLRYGLNAGSFTIGYAGSVLHYEGLDDVARAVASLVATGIDAVFLVAGDGEALEDLQQLSKELGIERRVKLVGRIAPEDTPRIWSLADVAAFARKPFRVCELVSPLKPLEPMAMGIPVVVSSVAALAEMVRDGQTGLVHTSGDVSSLTEKLRLLANDTVARHRLGLAGRAMVLRERTWDCTAERVTNVYRRLTSEIAVPTVPLPPGRSSMSAAEKALFEQRLEEAYAAGRGSAARDLARRQAEGRSDRLLAFCLLKAASCCHRYGDALELPLAREALARDDSAGTLRGVARALYAAGDFAGALPILDRLSSTLGTLTGKDDELAREVRSRNRLIEVLHEPAAGTRITTTHDKSVYFLHFSLPYSSVGYATRSHGLLMGIQAEGYDARAYTRCGFPQDFKTELEDKSLPEFDVIDGIEYRRLLEGGRRGSTESEYLLNCADAYERVLRTEKPEVVHAASNYVTALPALIAARRLGLPFIYEIRGFWEITRSSRDNEFQNSARFALMKHFEGLVATQADHIFTLTSAMKAELVRRGVNEAKISLVHNGVDAERFVPLSRRHDLAARIGLPSGVPVIGYVGSFVDYEGLDDLIRATAMLSRRGRDFRLLMVGDGATGDDLRTLAEKEGVADRTIFTGRVPHEDVEGYYSLIDVCPFPRKPWEVCEMVSPLKPFEAMAMGKVVVVSSTHALCEIVDHGATGLVFEKGSTESLADALQNLVDQPKLRYELAEKGRAWTLQHRTWREGARVVVAQYRALVATRNQFEREQRVTA